MKNVPDERWSEALSKAIEGVSNGAEGIIQVLPTLQMLRRINLRAFREQFAKFEAYGKQCATFLADTEGMPEKMLKAREDAERMILEIANLRTGERGN
jgi:hypothetical protein